VQDNILYIDNMSAMLLEKNGCVLSSKRTKHINLRYFYIKDKVDQEGDVSIEHSSPAENMLADFFTKPLQGSLFFILRDCNMNIDPKRISKFHSCHRSMLDHETSPVPGVQTKESEPGNHNSCSSIMIDHRVQHEKESVMMSPKDEYHKTEMEPE
jgi:hypothetical protein